MGGEDGCGSDASCARGCVLGAVGDDLMLAIPVVQRSRLMDWFCAELAVESKQHAKLSSLPKIKYLLIPCHRAAQLRRHES